MATTITVIAGDEIGPEVTDVTLSLMAAAGAELEYDRQLGGVAAVKAVKDPLPKETLDSIRRTGVALKGPLTTPLGSGFRSINVAIRKEFELYANVRPVVTLVPGQRYEDIDLVLIRENTEGLYVGVEHYIGLEGDPRAAAESVMIITDSARRESCDTLSNTPGEREERRSLSRTRPTSSSLPMGCFSKREKRLRMITTGRLSSSHGSSMRRRCYL